MDDIDDVIELERVRGEVERDSAFPPSAEDKPHKITFLKDVVERPDNTKTANLTDDELGILKLPVRTHLSIANYCTLLGMGSFARVFQQEGQMINATSLSSKGILINLAVTDKKQTETSMKRTSQRVKKGGMFSKDKVVEEPNYGGA